MSWKVIFCFFGLLIFAGLTVGCAKKPDSSIAVPQPAATSTPATGDQNLNIAFKNDPDPPQAGDNTIEVTIKRADGTPVTDAAVNAVFYMPAMPSMNMPEMRSTFTLTPSGDGRYSGQGQLVMSGTWDVTVNVTREGQKLASSKFTVIAK